jgi:nucleotide-binding universal stress UspA family protein
MTTAVDTTLGATPTPAPSVFSRVLVGVDGSCESREATRQAAALAEGELTLLAAFDAAPALVATTGSIPPPYLDVDVQREGAEKALVDARLALGDRQAGGKIVQGCSWIELIREIENERATLIVVGSHGHGRARGIIMGSTATELIHKAPCSVLVARDASRKFPRSIAVGVDGSPESALAYATASSLAERFGARLWPVVAHGGEAVDKRLVASIVGERHEDLPGEPVDALLAAAADADLLVVGSRGLHGLKALGSVSERVAHRARSSVLIVREPAWPGIVTGR